VVFVFVFVLLLEFVSPTLDDVAVLLPELEIVVVSVVVLL